MIWFDKYAFKMFDIFPVKQKSLFSFLDLIIIIILVFPMCVFF